MMQAHSPSRYARSGSRPDRLGKNPIRIAGPWSLAAVVILGCHTPIGVEYGRSVGLSRPGLEARSLFVELGCVGCHNVRGAPRPVGLDLALVEARDANGDEVVDVFDARVQQTHLRSPTSVRPASLMPDLGLDESKARALTVLVLGLAREAPPIEPVPETLRGLARGRALYRRLGCAGCHGPEGRGTKLRQEIARPPVLQRIAETLVVDAAEAGRLIELVESGAPIDEAQGSWVRPFLALEATIRNGRIPEPSTPPKLLAMPAFGSVLTKSDLDALGGYLVSLFPADAWESWE